MECEDQKVEMLCPTYCLCLKTFLKAQKSCYTCYNSNLWALGLEEKHVAGMSGVLSF
jgi:hypothetical protein